MAGLAGWGVGCRGKCEGQQLRMAALQFDMRRRWWEAGMHSVVATAAACWLGCCARLPVRCGSLCVHVQCCAECDGHCMVSSLVGCCNHTACKCPKPRGKGSMQVALDRLMVCIGWGTAACVLQQRNPGSVPLRARPCACLVLVAST